MHTKNKLVRRSVTSLSKAPMAPRFAAPRRHADGASRHHAHRPIDPAVVFADLLPGLVEGKSGFAWACCPFHDDHNPSLCVNVVSGWYRCHSTSCAATGTNIVGFVGRLLAIEPAAARRHLESHYG